MLFSERDMDLLRLLRWCRCIFREDGERYFSRNIVANLAALSYLKLYREYDALLLTAAGNRFLESIFPALPKGASLAYKRNDTQRRLRISRLVLTAYRAGVRVFITEMGELAESPALYLPSLMRGRGHNPWGNTRTAAVAHLGDLTCAFHYVCPGIGKLMLAEELHTFTNNTVVLKGRRQALIFAGDDYEELLRELNITDTSGDDRMISYGEAYRQAAMPVYLVACNDTGAMQLRLMGIPDYREKISAAALKAHYEPPPKDVPTWDALYNGIPFVMAADMDLRRVDTAVCTALNRGYRQIAIAVLSEQAEVSWFSRYRDTGTARVFALTESALTSLGCGEASLRLPSRQQFLTGKGDVVDAPLIQVHRKTGNKSKRSGREMD